MEKRLNTKMSHYLVGFKNELKERLLGSDLTHDVKQDLIKFIYDYDGLEFTTDDLAKRKRVKNVVPLCERCCAKRANNDQCTRRKKDGLDYCGTHLKGTPNGMMSLNTEPVNTSKKVEVWGQDFMGITYYIDKDNNVYNTEDVVKNVHNPKVIAKYEISDGVYTIPEFNLNM